MTTDGCTDTDTFSLRVYEPPAAAFSNSLPCSGQAVQFNNTSTTDSWSSVTTTNWNFGDPASGSANNSSDEDPSHIFSGTSSYNVQLIVTSDRGCIDTAFRNVSPLPVSPAIFTYSPTCFGDLMEFFNPGSSLDSMYSWQFGDNQTSYLPEPAHFYALPGTYTVTLSVISVSGCVTTATRPATVSPVPVAAFTTGTSCIGSPLLLTDQSQLSSGAVVNRNWWAEGQGSIGTGTVAQVTYPDTGQYRIRLTVTSDIGCTDSISQNVTVHSLPIASFSFDPQFGNPPLAVDFDNLSTGASTYSWDFGDGTSSNTAEPSHVFQDSGLYSIRLVAKSIFGCVDTTDKSIFVVRPVLDIAVTGDSSYRSGSYFHIVTRLSNLGTRDIDRVTIEAQLEDGSVIREKLFRLIPTGPVGSTTYQFTASFLLEGDRSPAYYCVRALDPNDEADAIPENNEKCYNPGQQPVLLLYPNPAAGPMNLDLLMPSEELITIELYDQLGRPIRRIDDGKASAGLNRYPVNMTGESGGTYTVKVIFRDRILVKQFVYLK